MSSPGGGPLVSGRYLEGLSEEQRAVLLDANAEGIRALTESLGRGDSVAFLGAGASAPLYPLWAELVGELIGRAVDEGLSPEEALTCRQLAGLNPDTVVEIVRRELGTPRYRAMLRDLFRVRRDQVTGRSWTPTQELVVRCAFAGVVTTNYDPGIVDARMRVRDRVSGTGFATWADEDPMDRWRKGSVFGDDELPVLFAHGHHNRPEDIVLATVDYRRAYGGKLAKVLHRLVDDGRLVWIGFSFADKRIDAIIREVTEGSGTSVDPGVAPQHVAIMPWDPEPLGAPGRNNPGVLRKLAEIQYCSRLVLYPAPAGDHTALQLLLADLTDPRYPAVATGERPGSTTARPRISAVGNTAVTVSAEPAGVGPPSLTRMPADAEGPDAEGLIVEWAHGGVPVSHFTGRAEELARLDRWAADGEVRLVGVTAWGGQGKTALVTEWLTRRAGARHRSGLAGVFGWSFYQDATAEHWADRLLAWAENTFAVRTQAPTLAGRVLELAHKIPLMLVLDGLEVLQERSAAGEFGRLLDGTLREVLTGWCQHRHAGLAVLTSRFPFADLGQFEGEAARMLDVPSFTQAEGSELLEAVGGGWLSDERRRQLVAAVDGHALAVATLARMLADRPPVGDLGTLQAELLAARRTDLRVNRVLRFYADELDPIDRHLVAIVALFPGPVAIDTLLALGNHQALGSLLAGQTAGWVENAARHRLAGLLSWHPDRTLSTHPLVRDAFRPLVLTGDAARLASDTSLAGLPTGTVRTADDATKVVEMIELLLDAEQWQAADQLYRARVGDRGQAWRYLPAVGLGQRAATAFVSTANRQRACGAHLTGQRLGHYLNVAGLHGIDAGDVSAAELHLSAAVAHRREAGDVANLAVNLRNLSERWRWLGDAERAQQAAAEALRYAEIVEHNGEIWRSRAYLAAALSLGGQTAAAAAEFAAADLICRRTDPDDDHLYAASGAWLAEFLFDVGRHRLARQRAARNGDIGQRNGWTDDVARCQRILARCDLIDGRLDSAKTLLDAAAASFLAGGYLTEWSHTLPDLAEYHRLTGDPGQAEALCNEALAVAGPRRLIPAQGRALAARALARTDRSAADGDSDLLGRARDDADHAFRIATRTRRLPWLELYVLTAHARIDEIIGTDHGWQEQESAVRRMLIPDDLDSHLPPRLT